jgi:hypothetical protein
MDIEKSAGGGMAFKKNLSVISMDGHGNPTTAPVHSQAASIAAPHMMLNISYNMNNNIDANSAA